MSEFNACSSNMEQQLLHEVTCNKPDVEEREVKKIKLSLGVKKNEKLEQRLGGILCCAVCLDLPCTAVYQV